MNMNLKTRHDDDPIILTARAIEMMRHEMLDRLDGQDREIAKVKEQTRSLEKMAQSANWWGGENHETVTTFLKNQRICVPDGSWHKGGDKSWYWKVSCEFGDIIRSLHHDVEHSPRCARKGTGYAEFKPWHYPMAWLEEALPIWVAGYGRGRIHWFRHRDDLIPQPQNGFSFHES